MRITISFRTDNLAFFNGISEEGSKVIKDIGNRFLDGRRSGRCYDSDKNIIGKWKVTYVAENE